MGCLEGHDFWVKLNFNNFVNAEFLGKISPQQSCLIMKLMGLIFTYEILRFIAFLMMVRPKTSDQNYIRVINNFPSGSSSHFKSVIPTMQSNNDDSFEFI